jgi:holliday junction DNA helicase RuvA
MIAYLSGKVKDFRQSSITLVVSGVGFLIHVPDQYNFQTDEDIFLEIYSHYNQENGYQFFGFKTKDEKNVFSLILGCSGVGPKIGLATLTMLSPSVFISAIMTEDLKTLSSIDGVGRKKAESIILQLKDKVSKVQLSSSSSIPQAASSIKQLSEVLTSLGYGRQEISITIERLKEAQALNSKISFDELVRKALALLSKK